MPNFEKYIDTESDDIKFDFGYETNGYEAPYGKAQLVMIYNSDKLSPITGLNEFMEAAKANPGKLTYPAPPDFTGSAFVRNLVYEKVGYDNLKNIEPNNKRRDKKSYEACPRLFKRIKTISMARRKRLIQLIQLS